MGKLLLQPMQLRHNVTKKADVVFEYLTDMQKFVAVHPVILKIDKIKENSFLAHEKLTFGKINITFNYPFTIEKNKAENEIIMRANVLKLILIEIRFNLIEAEEYTTIEEKIIFKSMLPVKFILLSIFLKQHKLLFENIEIITN
jgi:carbon monoxide dehydrogenase subunit G